MKYFFLALVCLALPCSGAIAQTVEAPYPSRPIRLVIPFVPGSGSDQLGRLIANQLSQHIKQVIIIDNKPGAGGSIGSKEVAKAPADGYTILMATSSTHGIGPWIYSNLGFDPEHDFAPITMLAKTDYALAVPANSPVKNIKDLIALSKAGDINYASSGNGTTAHLASSWLAAATNMSATHVPYKGSVPAITDLIGGQSSFYFDNTFVLVPFTKSGKLRIIATSGQTRSVATKDIPTVIESGVPGFELIGWWCLLAPAHTPDPILQWLNKEVASILNSKEIKEHLIALGNEPFATSTADTQAYMTSQRAFYKTIVDLTQTKLN